MLEQSRADKKKVTLIVVIDCVMALIGLMMVLLCIYMKEWLPLCIISDCSLVILHNILAAMKTFDMVKENIIMMERNTERERTIMKWR